MKLGLGLGLGRESQRPRYITEYFNGFDLSSGIYTGSATDVLDINGDTVATPAGLPPISGARDLRRGGRFFPSSTADLIAGNHSLDGWTVTTSGNGGTCTISSGNGADGVDCLEFSITDESSQVRATRDISIVVSSAIGIWVNFLDYPGSGGFYLALSSDNFASYFSFTIDADPGGNRILTNGWQFVPVQLSQFKNNNGASWGDTMTKIRIVGLCESGYTNQTTRVGAIYANLASRPQCLLSFDDGADSDFDIAATYMATKNLVATTYIIPSLVGTGTRLSENDLSSLALLGWDIAGHHESVFAGETYETQLARLETVKDYLAGLGYTKANRHFAYPQGEYDANTGAAMESAGMLTGRTVRGLPVSPVIVGDRGVFDLHSPGANVSLGTTASRLLFDLDAAIDAKTTYHIHFHRLLESGAANYNWDATEFRNFIDGLAQRRDDGMVDVLTISQWYNQSKASGFWLDTDFDGAEITGSRNVKTRSGTAKAYTDAGSDMGGFAVASSSATKYEKATTNNRWPVNNWAIRGVVLPSESGQAGGIMLSTYVDASNYTQIYTATAGGIQYRKRLLGVNYAHNAIGYTHQAGVAMEFEAYQSSTHGMGMRVRDVGGEWSMWSVKNDADGVKDASIASTYKVGSKESVYFNGKYPSVQFMAIPAGVDPQIWLGSHL